MEHVSRPLGGLIWRPRPRVGIRPTLRFVVAFALTLAWVAFSIYVSQPWRAELARAIGPVMAWVIPTLLAYIPGVLIGFLAFTLITARYRPPSLTPPDGPWPAGQWPAVTLIVAARDEEDAIVPTLERFAEVSYSGPLHIVLADNDSSDRTAERAQAAALSLGLRYRRVFEPTPGKHRTLNTALATVTTPLVVTVDADTTLHREGLIRLIARVTSRPQGQHICACAGALVARNVQANFLTRMQGWDYRLGINGVKRMQAAYNTALVAQGAFSAYWTDDIRAVGGWPDAIGEDIVLTWSLMLYARRRPVRAHRTRVHDRARQGFGLHAPAIALGARNVRRCPNQSADSPTPRAREVRRGNRLPRALPRHRLHLLLDTRSRSLPLRLPPHRLVVVDARHSLHPAPLWLLRRWQERYVFRPLGVLTDRDRSGFLGYLFAYQALSSSAALRGYWQYLTGAARRWK